MRTQNPQIERTPTTLIVRQTQLPQRGWLAFGGCWLVLLAPAGCVFAPLALFGSIRWLSGTATAGLALFGLIFLVFVSVGGWLVWKGLQGEHLEAHVWTFDKVSRRLIITRQLRNRRTQARRIEQVESYPLPMSGSVEMRSTPGAEHFEHELIVTIDGTTVRGMRQWAMQGDLRQVARDINEFLAA